MSAKELSSRAKIEALEKAERIYKQSNGMAVSPGEGRDMDMVIAKKMDVGKSFKEAAKKVSDSLQDKTVTQDKTFNSSPFDLNK